METGRVHLFNRRRSVRDLWSGILIALAAVALYMPVVDNAFIDLDDPQYVTNNFHVLYPSWQGLRDCFSEVWLPSDIIGYYQPLTIASLMLDRVIDGRLAGSPTAEVAPFVFHLTNILLHGLNTLLVFVICRYVSRLRVVGVICALLFAVHPLNVEVVAWVAQRKALLSTAFAFGALICHGRYAKTNRAAWYLLTWAAFVFSLLAKPTGLLLPFVLILADVWPLRRISRRSILEQAPMIVTAVVFGWISVESQGQTAGLARNAGVWTSLLILCQNVYFYSNRVLFPYKLCPVHPMPALETVTATQPEFLAGLIWCTVLGALLVLAWWYRRTFVWVCFISFLLLLAPAMSPWRFMQAIVAERFAYLPMIGLLVMLAEGLRRGFRVSSAVRRTARRKVTVVAFMLGICGFALLTFVHQDVWRNSRIFYEAVTERYPDHPYGYCGLGTLYLNEHELIAQSGAKEEREASESLLSAAMKEYEHAVLMDPDYGPAHFRIAQVLLLRDEPKAALSHLEQHPEALDFYRTYYVRGQALDRLGDKAGAIESFRECLRHEPGWRDARRQLARLLLETGHAGASLPHFELLESQAPMGADTLQNWAVALVQAGRLEEAINRMADVEKLRVRTVSQLTGDRRAQELSKLADARFTSAAILAAMNRSADSLIFLRAAISQKPELLALAERHPAFEGLRETDEWRRLVAEFGDRQ